MNESAEFFCLMDKWLPQVEDVELAEVGELQQLYAGIGMPALRVFELCQHPDWTFHQVKAANPMFGLVDSEGILNRYTALRNDALDGDPDALVDLGWWWMNGLRLKANPSLAKRLFNLAMDMGCDEAIFNLAEMAYYGKGQEVDIATAIFYYEKAYKEGHPLAATALGRLYEDGYEGVSIDHVKALKYYKAAAHNGDLYGCYLLGNLASDESSAAYDLAIGIYWLQWAAMSGERFATERLVEIYSSAFNPPPDPNGLLCKFWRDLAVSQGASLF